MSDTNVHMELVDQRNEEERWREEAARRLAPVPGQREALEAFRQRQRQQAEKKGKFKRVLRFLRGGR
ncbi:hypothetical protein vBSmQDWS359_57 [Stenotrophomonas phage vB_Sm_QDWS359]|uniref:Uncharacterized protein n=1 Tax=Stenotrophomonas phage vB_Sm_QDWS359 TaxID=2943841 RepID=A0A9E7DKX1_9CAUD|nr:hypothetical protein P9A46_gp65 [Stenotrophomonas phage vB_Sm_QDWS359]UQM93895.1 hypothetical protein vBSmQDWS359_57 [Stenotrophomonas phage vB_Sm_QDWS359]